MQVDTAERGFSFSFDAPLDMRMDPSLTQTAADLLAHASEKELGCIFRDFGEVTKWRRLAQRIVERRTTHPLLRTGDLLDVVYSLHGRPRRGETHPATTIFQALRIAVNGELEALETFLMPAMETLQPNGRMGVISFHSLEDRRVKTAFQYAASDKENTSGMGGGVFLDKEPLVDLVTRKPQKPSEEEVTANPRSRSARLRVVEKR